MNTGKFLTCPRLIQPRDSTPRFDLLLQQKMRLGWDVGLFSIAKAYESGL